MKHEPESRYVYYLRNALDLAAASGEHDRNAVLDELLNGIRTNLVGGGYDASLIEAECAEAKAAANLLREPVQKTDAAREQTGTSLRSETPALREGANAPTSSPVTLLERLNSRAGRIVLLTLLALAYLAPLFLFYRESLDTHATIAPGSDALALELRIGVVDFGRDAVTFHVVPYAGNVVLPDGRLRDDVALEIDAGTGPLVHTFKANAHVSPWTVTAAVDQGDILEYPFDRHMLELVINAKSAGQKVRVSTHIEHVPHGYRARLEEEVSSAGDTTATVHIRRAGTIIFVALLSVASLILVTFGALTVAWEVTANERKIEFSMMVWVAALLFVIPTVRNALPGSIPPGALIDFVVFFWLQIGVVIAMASLVISWKRRPGS